MLNILIIEDDDIQSSMYKKLLDNHGFSTHVAKDGMEGLKKALEIHPDLILLDIRMLKMDGMTVLHEIRKDTWGKTAKIVILTNYDADDIKLSGIVADQPSYYLLKSNNRPENVLEKINEILDNTDNNYGKDITS